MGNIETFRFCPICTAHLNQHVIDSTRRMHCTNCGFIQFTNPSPTAGVIAIKDKKIVMIKRGRQPALGKWSFPSGFIEVGESPEEAALRELKEEAGVTGKILGHIGTYYEVSEVYGDLIIVMYLVEITGGELKAGDDAVDVKLFRKIDVPKFKFKCFKKSWTEVNKMCHDLDLMLD